MNIIEAAKQYLGIHEGTKEHRALIDKYNKMVAAPYGCYHMQYSDPWCAAFASLCAADAGISNFPFSAACQNMEDWAMQHNRWSKTPSIGGLVIYDWDKDGIADHVGIVIDIAAGAFTSIEGNTTDMCAYRNYPINTAAGFITLEHIEQVKKEYKALNPVCKEGDKGLFVQAMQCLLKARDYDIGPDGADGDMGTNTTRALKKMQKDADIASSGVCDAETWRKLIS